MGRDEGDIVTEQTANEQHWIVLGDIHEGSPEVAEIPELAGASGLLVTGDLTNLGGVTRAKKVLADLRACHTQVFAQIGNMDRTEVDEWLSAEAVNLHRTVHELAPDVAVFGVGGSIFTPFGTPSEFPESKFSIWLEECWQKACRYKARILISHNPPFGTAVTLSRLAPTWEVVLCRNLSKSISQISVFVAIFMSRVLLTVSGGHRLSIPELLCMAITPR